MLDNFQVETRDKTGEVIRINADDDDLSLGELVRQERFGAGANDQKSMDAALANAIATDAKYEVSGPDRFESDVSTEFITIGIRRTSTIWTITSKS
jgi:hypothetical protein